MVLLGEMRHCRRTLLTFTLPFLGTAGGVLGDLRGLDELRRLEQEVMDADAARPSDRA